MATPIGHVQMKQETMYLMVCDGVRQIPMKKDILKVLVFANQIAKRVSTELFTTVMTFII